ncbi:hypothetical protein L228DRAFT_235526 [Xylona heveae TC161]|uniref:Uncharacterized protein n=1 Tax=Xylona heveae (strain CBS 132557 / TC161) TaxID=1328760 RepID=A0A165JNL3_XYLHT|nr:hypothetical protein L228DRAFT_235526 [Xylona heveae TC161]KZF26456.1 hypothetical protein L228DRAFT_235526 [Xylona heveae TC161]
MHASMSIAACAIGLASMVQYCPAPPLLGLIGLGADAAYLAGSGLAGSAVIAGSSHIHKRLAPGVSQQAADQCASELDGVTVTFSPQGNNGLLVNNLPPACMDLSTVITGDYDAGDPIPMSSSSILFQGLSDDELNQIRDAVNAS